MATQIVTLVGVLIGALTSYLATAIAERAKFRRMMATRWEERKLDTYIEYITCVKELLRAARAALRARDRGEDATEALAEMEEIESRRSILFEGFVLLSDEAAASAAHVVNQRAWDLHGLPATPPAVRPSSRTSRWSPLSTPSTTQPGRIWR